MVTISPTCALGARCPGWGPGVGGAAQGLGGDGVLRSADSAALGAVLLHRTAALASPQPQRYHKQLAVGRALLRSQAVLVLDLQANETMNVRRTERSEPSTTYPPENQVTYGGHDPQQ